MNDHTDPDFVENARLARRLPPKQLRQNFELLVKLVERPGSGSLTVDKAPNGKVFLRAHGNEFGSAEYDLVRDPQP